MSDDNSEEYKLDEPTDEDRAQASTDNVAKMEKFVENFAGKSGTFLHRNR